MRVRPAHAARPSSRRLYCSYACAHPLPIQATAKQDRQTHCQVAGLGVWLGLVAGSPKCCTNRLMLQNSNRLLQQNMRQPCTSAHLQQAGHADDAAHAAQQRVRPERARELCAHVRRVHRRPGGGAAQQPSEQRVGRRLGAPPRGAARELVPQCGAQRGRNAALTHLRPSKRCELEAVRHIRQCVARCSRPNGPTLDAATAWAALMRIRALNSCRSLGMQTTTA